MCNWMGHVEQQPLAVPLIYDNRLAWAKCKLTTSSRCLPTIWDESNEQHTSHFIIKNLAHSLKNYSFSKFTLCTSKQAGSFSTNAQHSLWMSPVDVRLWQPVFQAPYAVVPVLRVISTAWRQDWLKKEAHVSVLFATFTYIAQSNLPKKSAKILQCMVNPNK